MHKQKKVKKIAIVFGAKIGDVVNVQPVCRVLRQAYPDADIPFYPICKSQEIAVC